MGDAQPASAAQLRRVNSSALRAAMAAAVLFAALAAVALVLVSPPDAAAQGTSIRIVLDNGGDRSAQFEFFDQQTQQRFTLSGGQSRTVPVNPLTETIISQTVDGMPVGWGHDRIQCTGDNGSLAPFDQTVRGDIAPGSTVTCTFVNEFLGLAEVILTMDAGGNTTQQFDFYNDQARETFSLFGGQQLVIPVTATANFLAYQLREPSGWNIELSTCSDSAVTTRPSGALEGILAPGASVSCTLRNSQPPSAPITVEIVSDGDPSIQFDLRYRPEIGTVGLFKLRDGEDRTFEPFLDKPFELELFEQPGSRIRYLKCFGDNGVLDIRQGDEKMVISGTVTSTDAITCTAVHSALLAPRPGVFPTVTCLGGNGRIDINVVNPTADAAMYRLEVGQLSPRARMVDGRDWWRTPITGRQDGIYGIRVVRDGQVVMHQWVAVACDDDASVSGPEVQVMSACRNGSGFVVWQIANPSDQPQAYFIEFEGAPRRSTSAAPNGATTRGVSGREDGTYQWTVSRDSDIVAASSVTIDCQ